MADLATSNIRCGDGGMGNIRGLRRGKRLGYIVASGIARLSVHAIWTGISYRSVTAGLARSLRDMEL